MNPHDGVGGTTSNNPVITVDSWGSGVFPIPGAIIPNDPKYIDIRACENGFVLAPPVRYPSSSKHGHTSSLLTDACTQRSRTGARFLLDAP